MRLLDFDIIGQVTYAIYQREMENHEHFQGYMELDGQYTFNIMHSWPGFEVAHFEPRRGSQKIALAYCSKPNVDFPDDVTFIEGPWIYGEKKNQGQRSELMLIQRELNDGASIGRIAMDHFPEYIRFHKAFGEYRNLRCERRNWEMDVQIYVGYTGCGKTRRAYDLYGDSLYKQCNGRWFGGYDGEETVLIDEFIGERFTWPFLLQLTDRYPMTVEVKGSEVPFTSRRIIFTSNLPPETWFPQQDFAPLARRVSRRVTWTLPLQPTILVLRDGVFVPMAVSRSVAEPLNLIM